ncbi:NnrU family protein [Palleronia caenipelagi]|uniref:NnrU family protein n=1 Tax=Palleronia caenipelagi TaxID=2489174 RepID=A0A547PKX7_9RHOB|nr:NnrU family protein [Palleronia caenipelagi]TRD14799.1 NnrU family protein [Palleronia caenipelagi]
MGWIEFALAMGVFLISHRLPAMLGVKSKLTNALGQRGYTVLFSVVSLVLLWWVFAAAGRAPVIPLWEQSAAARWLLNLTMPVVILLAVFGVGAPNPFAFEGRPQGFDPVHPGIVGLTRQPLLWALILWSGAHLLANGDLAHVILFGSFLLFSAMGLRIVERRRRRIMGADPWNEAARRTGLVPFAALLRGRWRPQALPSLPRLGLAIGLWVVLLALHAPVIGVSPLP